MRLLLIRHGETVDNISGLYAGVSDSKLTNQGVLQASRLADSLIAKYQSFSSIFTSDLQRARKTGQAILDRQVDRRRYDVNEVATPAVSTSDLEELELQVLPILREQDFGSLELQRWSNKAGASLSDAPTDRSGGQAWVSPETKESMDVRANSFIDDHLWPLLASELDFERQEDQGLNVAVVSHGMLLSRLWKCLLSRCRDRAKDLTLASDVEIGPRGVEHLGAWSNTGYLVLQIMTVSATKTHKASVNEHAFRSGQNASSSPPYDGDPDNTTSNTASEEYRMASKVQDFVRSEQDLQELEGEPTSLISVVEKRQSIPVALAREVSRPSVKPSALKITVQAVNVTEHLRGLKRTRGGVGSAAHDETQRTMHSFFKKRPKT